MFSQYSYSERPLNSTNLLVEQVALGTVTQSFLDVSVMQVHREAVPIIGVNTEYLELVAIVVNPVVSPLVTITQEYLSSDVVSRHYEPVSLAVITKELLAPAVFERDYAVPLDLCNVTQLFFDTNVFNYFEIDQGIYTEEFPAYKVIDIAHADIATFRQIFFTIFQGYPPQIVEQESILSIQQKLDWDIKFKSVVTAPLRDINQIFPVLRVREYKKLDTLEYKWVFLSTIANTAIYADILGYSTIFLPNQLLGRFSVEVLEYIEQFLGVAIDLGSIGDVVLVPRMHAGELLQVLSDFTRTISKDKNGKNLFISLETNRTRNTIRVDI